MTATPTPRALILAAGRGERMRPLTDATPKPLLRVQGKPLIEWHLEALARAGVREVVINTAWLEEQFPDALGDGSRWGLTLHYSMEGRDHGGALETAGGIAKALPQLAPAGDEVFWVVSGDVFLPGFTFPADAADRFARSALDAQLWLVPNAPHHPGGDFGITPDGLATRDAADKFTWASVGLFRPGLFTDVPVGTRLALRPKLEAALTAQRLGAQLWPGAWTDVGTIERLDALNR
ncbi:N-acetylmuramate alpha-1-phosphate uridylyltransferase MurU [Ideonella margarita]|uniref:N-acetylmuramate alpha-1-phosphate uridylyltransferase MurU n=1 Tax=Ideonella margarita TaxID=2984191 RepID=A0ABU9C5U2_9BURK